ncbi:OmpH family outer membrane protein [Celeribacter halophilus]|uniref:OmpH family outer membrane protein n=1 Tax=Celeribacter halophilus TaxID=576117 RepID=UPI003A8CA2D0
MFLRRVSLAVLFALGATALCAQDAPQGSDVAAKTAESREVSASSGTKLVFPVLVFDRSRVLSQSVAGQALEAEIEEARAALLAENEQIYADLETEEQEIADAKPLMSEEAFLIRAQEFDTKVTEARSAQDQKARDIQTLYDDRIGEIEQKMNDALATIARDLGAVVVFERGQVYLMNGAIDISRLVIEKLDEDLAEDTDTAPADQDTAPSED